MELELSDPRRKELKLRTEEVVQHFSAVPKGGLGIDLRIQACVVALSVLEDRILDMNDDPFLPLLQMLSDISYLARVFVDVYQHLKFNSTKQEGPEDDHAGTRELFQTAWTTYDHETYAHSLMLIEERLERTGFDHTYFAGKRCIDSGCGTGRLAIAMAKAGAAEVVAADFGEESLAYLAEVKRRYDLPQVAPIKMDVTEMSAFETGSFDFVASHGVLHHTSHPDRGIREHFRITKPGGQLWLYLYGAGGIYWPIFDELRKLLAGVEPKRIRAILRSYCLRPGLIYTFLDNFLAPRVYYSLEQTLGLLRPLGGFNYRMMKGSSAIDDTEKLLSTKWGAELYGPDGEIRIVIDKDPA
jgi:ubiquinone/menaquinone biosynthesis C-methylase UbiE